MSNQSAICSEPPNEVMAAMNGSASTHHQRKRKIMALALIRCYLGSVCHAAFPDRVTRISTRSINLTARRRNYLKCEFNRIDRLAHFRLLSKQKPLPVCPVNIYCTYILVCRSGLCCSHCLMTAQNRRSTGWPCQRTEQS